MDVVLDAIQSGMTKRVEVPTRRKDITPIAQEPDFMEQEDEPEVTLPEGYDEMDFDDRRKSDFRQDEPTASPTQMENEQTQQVESPESDQSTHAKEQAEMQKGTDSSSWTSIYFNQNLSLIINNVLNIEGRRRKPAR